MATAEVPPAVPWRITNLAVWPLRLGHILLLGIQIAPGSSMLGSFQCQNHLILRMEGIVLHERVNNTSIATLSTASWCCRVSKRDDIKQLQRWVKRHCDLMA